MLNKNQHKVVNLKEDNEDFIDITVVPTTDNQEKKNRKTRNKGRRATRIDKTRNKGNSKKETKENDKKNKKWTKKQKIRVTIIVILTIFILLGTVLGVYIYKANGNLAEAALNMAADVLGEKDPIFVLVLGVSEDLKNELTDTIILCGYNPDSQKAFMLSIPRDTFVGKSEASAGGYDKINALYQTNVDKTVAAVEKLTGINIDNYVVVKNTALPAIVDAIGEVEFDVPIDMDYDDKTQDLHIHLEAGLQKIDGNEAEQLLRFRHNNDGSSYPSEYGDNDYGRMRTQREFIKTVAKKLITWESATNLKQITTAVFDNLETNINLSNILGYVPHGLKFDIETLRMEQLPGASAMINNLWFYKANLTQTKELVEELILSLEMDEKEIDKYYSREITNTSSKSQETNSKNTTKNNSKANTSTEKKNTTAEKITEKNKTNTEVDKNTTNTVKNDNDNVQKHEHKYTSTITQKPTCIDSGIKTYICADSNCKDCYTEKIPATGKHNYSGATCTVCGCKNPDYKEPTKPPETSNTIPEPKPPEISNTVPDTDTKPTPPVTDTNTISGSSTENNDKATN